MLYDYRALEVNRRAACQNRAQADRRERISDVSTDISNRLADIVTTEEFARRLDISVVTLLLWERIGTVPRARRLSLQNIVWHRPAVAAWFNDGMPKVKPERKIQNGKTKRQRDGDH